MIQNSRPVVALIRLIGWLTSYPSLREDRRRRKAEELAAVNELARHIAQARATILRDAARRPTFSTRKVSPCV